VGKTIVQRQAGVPWGEAVVERLAHDLRQAFPDLQGFSALNIWRTPAFLLAWSSAAPKRLTQPVSEIRVLAKPKRLPQAVAENPRGQNIVFLQKPASLQDRL
jgi:hypothetical protein